MFCALSPSGLEDDDRYDGDNDSNCERATFSIQQDIPVELNTH